MNLQDVRFNMLRNETRKEIEKIEDFRLKLDLEEKIQEISTEREMAQLLIVLQSYNEEENVLKRVQKSYEDSKNDLLTRRFYKTKYEYLMLKHQYQPSFTSRPRRESPKVRTVYEPGLYTQIQSSFHPSNSYFQGTGRFFNV